MRTHPDAPVLSQAIEREDPEPMTTSVTSNGVAVPFDRRHFAPLRDSSAVRSDPEAIRARYAEDGYLYMKGVLDPAAVKALREAYFAQFDRSYLRAGTNPADGVFSGRRPHGLPPHGVTGHPAHAFVRSSRFEVFASDPAFAALAQDVLGGPVTRLPRSIVRHFDRLTPTASRAHVDFSYLDRGSDQLVTIWIPIGDCPRATGGLVYLEGSHRIERSSFDRLRAIHDRPEDPRPISHNLAWVAEQLGTRWRWTDYQAGDIALHSAHIVHASLDTTTAAMRLSADLRFLRCGQPADPRWLVPWAGDDGN
jgi:ectoine hydroxylase-related dioxygenase (phytanoyl-CoA dioxygenase family)